MTEPFLGVLETGARRDIVQARRKDLHLACRKQADLAMFCFAHNARESYYTGISQTTFRCHSVTNKQYRPVLNFDWHRQSYPCPQTGFERQRPGRPDHSGQYRRRRALSSTREWSGYDLSMSQSRHPFGPCRGMDREQGHCLRRPRGRVVEGPVQSGGIVWTRRNWLLFILTAVEQSVRLS